MCYTARPLSAVVMVSLLVLGIPVYPAPADPALTRNKTMMP